MIIYLSLKQILLNQIAVLIRKQSDKSNDDPERLLRRLNYLQQALEQIKSYQHNSNFQYVIKHFNVSLSEEEQQQIRTLSSRYDDHAYNNRGSKEKSGFTTQRSETLFTGAAEEQYENFYVDDNEDIEDEKTAQKGHTIPQWIHYKGFAHWLKKQSFIKFKKRNDTEKYRKIWNTVLGLNMINQWERGKVKPMNIIGRYGTSQPYIAIHKCGSKEIVKGSLLRLSITQNRIFKFNISATDSSASAASKREHSRARKSIDMDTEVNEEEYNSEYTLSANQLIQGKNLFDLVSNKDVLRIVATMLWDTNLANNVLEELLHNPRFSMYGIHAKNIADTIAKEMNLEKLNSRSINEEKEIEKEKERNVAQFELPSPQKATSLQKQKEINQNMGYSKGGGGAVYNPDFNQKKKTEKNAFSFTKDNNPGHSPGHTKSGSVVFHDNLRDSEINDYGADTNQYYQDGDDEEDSVSNSADISQNR